MKQKNSFHLVNFFFKDFILFFRVNPLGMAAVVV